MGKHGEVKCAGCEQVKAFIAVFKGPVLIPAWWVQEHTADCSARAPIRVNSMDIFTYAEEAPCLKG